MVIYFFLGTVNLLISVNPPMGDPETYLKIDNTALQSQSKLTSTDTSNFKACAPVVFSSVMVAFHTQCLGTDCYCTVLPQKSNFKFNIELIPSTFGVLHKPV